MPRRTRSPALLLTLTESPRALAEMTLLATAWPLLGLAPKGDGHPVYVLPGFMAGDASTALLRRFLQRQGYQPHPWGFGTNLGPRGDLLDRVAHRVRTLHERTGHQVTLIGQSLGGVYAREIARALPAAIRQVMTLGSPFGTLRGEGTNAGVKRLYELATGQPPSTEHFRPNGSNHDFADPPPVPSTAIFSRLDGVAAWQICMERRSPLTDNIEITGSHCGMALNPQVMWLIADRLHLTRANWKPLDRSGLRGLLYGSARSAVDPVMA